MTTTDARSDTELLLAYGRDGDEGAFEALAGRHVDMIFAVSLRRSGNRQLAEEATQNVLVSLASKARKLSAQESNLTGWLHTSTRFEVAKLQRRETRIRSREQAYANDNMNTSNQGDDETFRRLLPVLDQAIDHLRATDREVIVRRYLEGQDFRRIGVALGISEDAAQKRSNRAFERLNLFFKRKVGVTVSATALAAGISQHCAEAAPAACLQIAGKAASAGLASFLTTITNTTITTMSISKITAVAASVVVLGGALALLANHDTTPAETLSTPAEKVSTPSPPPAESAAAVPKPSVRPVAAASGGTAGNAKPYSANAELAKLEATSPQPSKEETARRLSVKHEQLLKDLTKDLGLSAVQATSVKDVLDGRLKTFRASLETGPQPGDSPGGSLTKEKEMLAKAGGIIRGAGLREGLTGILADKQLAAFDEREAKSWQTQVESQSYRELAKLTPVLNLTEDQKDRAFELLKKSSSEKLYEDADVRSFMALTKNQTPTQVDMTDMAEANFFYEIMDGPNALPPGSPEFKKQIMEFVGGQIQKQVELLAPVLNPRQTQRYRDHLVQKSLLPQFGIKLPTPEKP